MEKLRIIQRVSIIVCILGIVLLIYMITVESEPGALPLVLVIIGTIGVVLTGKKLKSIK